MKIKGIILLFFCVKVHAQDYAHVVHATLWADYLCYDKQHARAHAWYDDVIHDATIPYPLRSYSLYLFDTKQYSFLLAHKKQLQDYFKDDLLVQKAIAVALVHEKQDAQAEQLFISLAAQFPTSYDVVLPAAQILIRRGEDACAQEMLEKVINTRAQRQVTSICMVLLAQLYIKAHNIEGAYVLMTQCTVHQPSYAPAWLILGTLEELKQNREGALQAYRTFSALSPVQIPAIEKRIAVLQLGGSVQSSDSGKQNDMQRIMFLIAQKKYAEALPVAKKAIAGDPRDATLRALYVHLLVTVGSYQSAIAMLVRYINEQPDDYRWWGALHILALSVQSSHVAESTLRHMRLYYPQSIWGYFYEADLAMRQRNFDDAHDLCMQACTISADEVVLSELYFMQALCGYEMHDYTIVTQALKKGLGTSVVHAPLYNLAAYYYAHIGDFKRAQELIVQCCALEPYNYHYQDTAAFILYKQQDPSQANKIFTALRAEHKTDATISLHGASVAHKQHDLVRARELCAQAENHAYSEYVKRRIQSYSVQIGTV